MNADDQTRRLKPKFQFKFWDTTYDRILKIYLSDDDIQNSWVALLSSQYGQFHLLRLNYVLQAQSQKENSVKTTIGGQYIESEKYDVSPEEIFLKLSESESLQFWEKVSARFTLDGSRAIVLTPEEAYSIDLDPDSENYLSNQKIPHLKERKVQ